MCATTFQNTAKHPTGAGALRALASGHPRPITNGRLGAVNQLRADLANHWADAVLDCAHAGEPLAHGMHRVEDALTVVNQRLRDLLGSENPTDRELAAARADRDVIESALDDRLSMLAEPQSAIGAQSSAAQHLDVGVER